MSDLAGRPNPSAWAELLRFALPVLDEAFGKVGRFHWSLGGGTAIALRISHRVSDDIDIFIEQADLRALSPYLPFKNAAAAALKASVQFPGNYLKLQLPVGEIDFLPGPMLSAPGFSAETFEGIPIALQTCEEVILRKVRYRAASFKARDVFDLAAVIRTCDDIGSVLRYSGATATSQPSDAMVKCADARRIPHSWFARQAPRASDGQRRSSRAHGDCRERR